MSSTATELVSNIEWSLSILSSTDQEPTTFPNTEELQIICDETDTTDCGSPAMCNLLGEFVLRRKGRIVRVKVPELGNELRKMLSDRASHVEVCRN